MASFALTLAFIVLAGGMLWSTVGLSRVSGWIPQVVLAATLALLLLQSVLDWRAAAIPDPAPGASADRRRREWAAAGWIGSLLLAAWLLGVVIGGALFCCAWLRWHAGERWRTAAVFGTALGLALWLVFGVLLRSALYPGLLSRILA
ncbi:MAG: tripartite tricarboxylate transporter TctB family protein [Xanthomonadales bacterium]|nr:tripartite tricarboxylate transporter TctB family protein [Xanthomonadales bacterium]